MANIKTIRHSLAHILAAALQDLYPGVKFGMGPAIENGFYYDFDFQKSSTAKISQTKQKSRTKNLAVEDLPIIEKKMRSLIKNNIRFQKKIISKAKAKEIFKDQPYKIEILEGLPGKTVSIYQSGSFVDLCKGPHIQSTKQIPADAFKLTSLAGAYWKGSEKNPMLTRIYGIAFTTKKELQDYLKFQQEAQKRDQRVLGEKLDLFHIEDAVGPGLVLWHPKGAILKRIIENYVLGEYLHHGYQLVNTPHIAKINLWQTSGHTSFYRESMFPPMHLKEISQEEKDDYEIKPMNCPFHILIYKRQIRSYRQLPLRYTELGTVYRYEKSGTLHGLTRVRGFTQDDAHIWCTPGQITEEVNSVLKFALKLLKTFGFKEYEIFLSTMPKKYVGSPKNWRKATNALKYALKESKQKYQIDRGGGAFYGPKIDIKIKDSLGRAWQCSTIQVDFNLPERFQMAYIDQKGKKRQPIMIHRALLGSIERFMGVLLEHYGGAFPLWLSPVQVLVVPIAQRHKKYAREIAKKLIDNQFRCEVAGENETVSKKIREGETQKIPYILVVGDKELESQSVRARKRGKGDIGKISLTNFIQKIKIEVESKK